MWAACVQPHLCDSHFMDIAYGKQIEIRCPLSEYDSCINKESECGPGLHCFGPLECTTCPENIEPVYNYQMCVGVCDRENSMTATRGFYTGHEFVPRYTSSECVDANEFAYVNTSGE